ncbi:MAG: hypothetical protein K8R53_05810, partial [Bacteroidales bacterium]|nr:hypothetical protein [Bacteroidales bacterium]
INDVKSIMLLTYNLGNVICADKDEENAIIYMRKSIDMANKLEFKPLVCAAWNILSNCYDKMGESDSSMHFARLTYNLAEELGDIQHMAFSLSNIGDILKRENKQDSAIYYYLKSLQLKEKIGQKRGTAIIYLKLSEIYI